MPRCNPKTLPAKRTITNLDSPPGAQRPLSIAILGTDAMLAAQPATPVQLAHACHAAGYSHVVPASWGDELVAAAVLKRASERGAGPLVQCSCPLVANRLLAASGDLRASMVSVVAPPVVLARYLRALHHPQRPRITYVGRCAAAIDDSFDAHVVPDELLSVFRDRGIVLDTQPRAFDSVIPPDRRRFFSLPGGIPAQERLASDGGGRTLVDASSEDVGMEVAQHLLDGRDVLIDVSSRLGCACAGAPRAGSEILPTAAELRVLVAALEPPRAPSMIVDPAAVELTYDLPIPAVSRAVADIAARASDSSAPALAPAPVAPLPRPSARATPTTLMKAIPEPRAHLLTPAAGRPVVTDVAPRSSLPAMPAAGATRPLPRTYVAKRRSSPNGLRRVEGPTAESGSDAHDPVSSEDAQFPDSESTSLTSDASPIVANI